MNREPRTPSYEHHLFGVRYQCCEKKVFDDSWVVQQAVSGWQGGETLCASRAILVALCPRPHGDSGREAGCQAKTLGVVPFARGQAPSATFFMNERLQSWLVEGPTVRVRRGRPLRTSEGLLADSGQSPSFVLSGSPRSLVIACGGATQFGSRLGAPFLLDARFTRGGEAWPVMDGPGS